MSFFEWLNSVECTAPFTVHDCRALYAMIRPQVDKDAKVDVYTTRGDEVIVRVETARGTLTRTIPVR